MRRKNLKVSDSKRICVNFTVGQITLLDRLIEQNGKLGGNKAEVVKQIVLKYLTENHLLD